MDDASFRVEVERARTALQEHHKVLVGAVAQDYEREHGPASAAGLLQLVAHDDFFAWLHPVSELVVALDDLLDSSEPVSMSDAAAVRVGIEAIIDRGPETFRDRYVALLQWNPDVAMTHAQVRRVIAGLPASAPEDVAGLLHARHKWAAARRKRRGPGA
jgi:hypothetical protein